MESYVKKNIKLYGIPCLIFLKNTYTFTSLNFSPMKRKLPSRFKIEKKKKGGGGGE